MRLALELELGVHASRGKQPRGRALPVSRSCMFRPERLHQRQAQGPMHVIPLLCPPRRCAVRAVCPSSTALHSSTQLARAHQSSPELGGCRRPLAGTVASLMVRTLPASLSGVPATKPSTIDYPQAHPPIHAAETAVVPCSPSSSAATWGERH